MQQTTSPNKPFLLSSPSSPIASSSTSSPLLNNNYLSQQQSFTIDLSQKSVSQLQYEQQYELPEKLENLRKQMIQLSAKNYNIFLQTEENFKNIKNLNETLKEKTLSLFGKDLNFQQIYQKLSKARNEEEEKNLAIDLFLNNKDNNNNVFDRLKKSLEELQLTGQQQYKFEKQKIQMSIDQSDKLLLITEFPQIFRQCLQNQMYIEILDLYESFLNLYSQHLNIPLLDKFKIEIDQIISTMINQLITKLKKENCNIKTSVQIISILKRMQITENEEELKILFLQCRNIPLQENYNLLNIQFQQHLNCYLYLSKLTNYFRVTLFDIVTQYKTVFGNSDFILSSFMLHLIQPYLNTLSHYLQQLNNTTDNNTINEVNNYTTLTGEEYNKLLEECMYCGNILSKIGIDFRPLIVHWFTFKVHSTFKISLTKSVMHFNESIRNKYKWKEYIQSSNLSNVINTTTSNVNTGVGVGIRKVKNNKILEYIPVAELLNDVLLALNELKCCCPIDLIHQIVRNDIKTLLLEPITNVMIDAKEQFDKELKDEKEWKYFKGICLCLIEDFINNIINTLDMFVKNNLSDYNLINIENLNYEQCFNPLKQIIESIKY
ncbi:hypothetical protein ABK040_005933 [Willaertia magna]